MNRNIAHPIVEDPNRDLVVVEEIKGADNQILRVIGCAYLDQASQPGILGLRP